MRRVLYIAGIVTLLLAVAAYAQPPSLLLDAGMATGSLLVALLIILIFLPALVEPGDDGTALIAILFILLIALLLSFAA